MSDSNFNIDEIFQWNIGTLWNVLYYMTETRQIDINDMNTVEKIKSGFYNNVYIKILIEQAYQVFWRSNSVRIGKIRHPLRPFMEDKEKREVEIRKLIMKYYQDEDIIEQRVK